MRDWITTGGELTGAAFFAKGCFDYSHPLGFAVIGVLVGLFSWLAAR